MGTGTGDKRVNLDEISEKWVAENIAQKDNLGYSIFKSAIDLIFTAVGLVFLAIFFLPVAFLIKIDSKGRVLFKQERLGKNGKKFILYKFRTMYEDKSPQLTLWREKDKSNITRVGKVLRRLHTDELPQVLNMLMGQVSFIGPRAEWYLLAEKFEKEIPFYKLRYLVKPGIIGWAQINYPPSRSIDEAKEKFEYDLYYIKNRSIFLDFKIILNSWKLFFW